MMILTMSMRLKKTQLKLMEPNQNTINGSLKGSQNDVQNDPHDTKLFVLVVYRESLQNNSNLEYMKI